MKHDPLDLILAEQLYAARRRLKTVNNLLKLMPTDPFLIEGRELIEKKIRWYESMLPHKLHKRKKRIDVRRTFNTIVYTVRFIYFFKVLLSTKKEKQ